MKASDLIRQARLTYAPKPLTAVQLRELKTILAYNDSIGQNRTKRVGAGRAVAMLRELGWVGSRLALDALCVAQLGRQSYTRA